MDTVIKAPPHKAAKRYTSPSTPSQVSPHPSLGTSTLTRPRRPRCYCMQNLSSPTRYPRRRRHRPLVQRTIRQYIKPRHRDLIAGNAQCE